MRTSDRLLKQVRRALAAVLVLGGFTSLLSLALPLYVLGILAIAASAGNAETLGLLTVAVGGAALTLLCVEAMRGRILLRAGLWLDHTLGQQMLENGLRLGLPPSTLKQDADALACVCQALKERVVLPVLDAPWTPVFLIALTLLHPLMGGIAALCALVLVLVALGQARPVSRLERSCRRAIARVQEWWPSVTAVSVAMGPAAEMAAQWERLNRAHVASAYALGRRMGILQGIARSIRWLAQIGMIALGGWLVMHQELTVAALLACLLIQARVLAPLHRIVASLGVLRGAASASRHLASLPADWEEPHRSPALARPARSRTSADGQIPRLDIRGPLAIGYAAVLIFLAASVSAAILVPAEHLAQSAGLWRSIAPEVKVMLVQHAKGGIGASVHVTEGAQVKAGDLLVTLDTAVLDRQIVALQAQAASVKTQLESLAKEAAMISARPEPTQADRDQVQSLEQRIAALEKESQDLLTRIAAAELDLARSEIRAPVSGRVVSLAVRRPGTVIAPGATVAEIASSERNLLDRLAEPIFRHVHRAFRI
ncbi:MAG: biotin/lipoyl-binding protein [Hyphomicrobiaceae bacterium]|nr:MAG: biotin/lipoyl-binding protein [Hyphomicrobiaceae bacterium]